MEKSVTYPRIYFAAEILQEAIGRLDEFSEDAGVGYLYLTVSTLDATWSHDDIEEFWADYRRSSGRVDFGVGTLNTQERTLSVVIYGEGNSRDTEVFVNAPARREIERIFDVFERSVRDSKLPDDPSQSTGKIFLGHGRSLLWRELHSHLRDQHHLDVEAYEVGARAGHAIRDILEDMLSSSAIAFLVMAAEDEMADAAYRARQNVVHELGLFQGRLGFNRAIALVEEDTTMFTNMAGVQQIRFSKGNIQETFGEVLATIRRELGQ